MRVNGLVILVAAVALAPRAGAQTARMGAAASCPAQPAAPPAAFAGWSRGEPRYAAATVAGARQPLPLARGVRLRLAPTAKVAYASPPDRPGHARSYGGLATIVAPRPGRYQVALSSGAWVDVVGAGRALRSAAHQPGPACTGIRKVVAFDLAPGRYLLQIVDNYDPEVTVLVRPPG